MIKSILFSDSTQKLLAPTFALLITSALALANSQSVFAQDESSMGYYSESYKPITNDQFLSLSKNSPALWLFRAEIAIKGEKWDQAIVYLRKSLEGYDDDIDTHKWLALSLEEKMKQQEERDPKLFKECIKEWLIVARQEKGPEKGLAFKNGVSPGNMIKRYGDEEGSMMAFDHLTKLTGRPPKKFETDKKYLARVAKEAEQRVAAKIVPKKSGDGTE
jgi:hypothetical protein